MNDGARCKMCVNHMFIIVVIVIIIIITAAASSSEEEEDINKQQGHSMSPRYLLLVSE